MKSTEYIPYHKVYQQNTPEMEYFKEVLESGKTSGNQEQCKQVSKILNQQFEFKNVLLMPSATSALESMALLLNIQAGDEIIMPSFTFVSTANAFLLRGAKIVFVDIEEETLNVCPKALAAAITPKTKACVVIHYAGVAAKIKEIQQICHENGIYFLEDAAQCLGSQYQSKYLGSFGTFSCLSFHESKIVQCGEGGALIINDDHFLQRARYIQDKGTNRHDFKSGKVSKYQWQDIGSSYLLSELNAAYLRSQLESWKIIVKERIQIWEKYHKSFQDLEERELLRRMKVTSDHSVNGHIYYLIFNSKDMRDKYIQFMRENLIEVTTHYEPLHLSPMAKKLNSKDFVLKTTEKIAEGLVRLPIYPGLKSGQDKIIDMTQRFLSKI